MTEINLILLPLLGFLIGLFVTTMGGGGGVFFVPVLTLLFHTSTQMAVATSLACILPVTVIGAYSHHRQGNVDIRTGLILAAGAVLGVLAGAYIANMLPSLLLKKFFGVFLLILTIPMVRSASKRYRKEKTKTSGGFRSVTGLFFGIASGLMAGIFGISGTPPLIAGLYLLGLPAQAVIGTSIFVLIFNSITGVIGYFLLGQFNLSLILLLGGGGAAGAFLGPELLKNIKKETLEKIYAPLFVTINLIISLAMIFL
ncbi:MAG TPA: sulfite exporter TauE/SafE family protein [Smithella sp.]|nr:sulfite exporter TauE/SafE family protein [Smithella sp.]